MPKTIILPLLSSGEFLSGQLIADTLGVSRTAVWKQLKKLEDLGLEIESVKGKGYRIPGGLELLDEAQIKAGLTAQNEALLTDLIIDQVIDSTNAEVLRRVAQGARAGVVCTAEQQSSGRGRRGRSWVSPFARNVYFSLTGEFTQGAAALEGLSLAVGVGVARALEQLGITGAQLKWPNDILFEGAKLGGILLEMVGDAAGHCQLAIGVGMNVAMPEHAAQAIEQDWTDVKSIAKARGVACPGRNDLLGALLNELLPLVAGFEDEGFAHWRQSWEALDAHAGKPVILSSGDGQMAGVARGVNERGALQLETGLGIQSVFGGEVSLRESK